MVISHELYICTVDVTWFHSLFCWLHVHLDCWGIEGFCLKAVKYHLSSIVIHTRLSRSFSPVLPCFLTSIECNGFCPVHCKFMLFPIPKSILKCFVRIARVHSLNSIFDCLGSCVRCCRKIFSRWFSLKSISIPMSMCPRGAVHPSSRWFFVDFPCPLCVMGVEVLASWFSNRNFLQIAYTQLISHVFLFFSAEFVH